jgi:two-component system NtrC family sensor kinase
VRSSTRILVADDETAIRDIYGMILSPAPKKDCLAEGAALLGGPDPGPETKVKMQYELTLVGRGVDAIQAVQEAVEESRPFAVAFIDLNMPGIDGIETAKRIYAEDPNVKIVIVTGLMEYTLDEIADKIGRRDIVCLQKPFSANEVEEVARSLTEKWALERKL